MDKPKWSGYKDGYAGYYRDNKLKELPRLRKYIRPSQQMYRELTDLYNPDTKSFSDKYKVKNLIIEHQVGGFDLRNLFNRDNYLFISEDIAIDILEEAVELPNMDIREFPKTDSGKELKKMHSAKPVPEKTISVKTKKGIEYKRAKTTIVKPVEIQTITQYIKERKEGIKKTKQNYYDEFIRLDGRYKLHGRSFSSFKTIWDRINSGRYTKVRQRLALKQKKIRQNIEKQQQQMLKIQNRIAKLKEQEKQLQSRMGEVR